MNGAPMGGVSGLPLVSGAYVLRWVELVKSRGAPAALLLEGTGLTEARLLAPGARVSPVEFARLLSRGVELAADRGLAFELGLSLKPTSHGLLGFALMSCSTLGEALELARRFVRLQGSPLELSWHVEGEQAVLELHEPFPLGEVRELVFEAVAGAIVRVGELLLGVPLPRDEVLITARHPEPAHYARFAGRLPPIRFSAPRDQGRFPRAWLGRPLALAEPATTREVVSTLERQLAEVFGDDPVATVRARLLRSEEGFPSLEAVARGLGVSERTLRRRLEARGVTYQALVDAARRERALELLGTTGHSLAQIAVRVGYSDATTLARAIRRWTGKAPGALRRG